MQLYIVPVGGSNILHKIYEDNNRGREPQWTVPLPASSASSVIITDIHPEYTKPGVFCHLSVQTQLLIQGISHELYTRVIPSTVACAE